jgi:DNA-nicking Smr family endonuclease
MARDGKGRRDLSDDERVLWSTVAKSIRPLPGATLPPPTEITQNADEQRPKRISPARPIVAPPLPPKPAAPPLSPLGRRKRSRVSRGKEAIDGRLDLHGLTQSEAHPTLLRFLHQASARQARLVLVITGKGGDGERGVLRRQLPQWLSLPEFRALVVGFEQAGPRHGGEGAWYVSVRRSRAGE